MTRAYAFRLVFAVVLSGGVVNGLLQHQAAAQSPARLQRRATSAVAADGALPPLGFSFSVSGLLFPYHIGVSEGLRSAGLLTASTPLQGASGGALAAAAAGAQIPVEESLETSLQFAALCSQRGTRGNLGRILREVLEAPGSIIAEDVHLRLTQREAACEVSYTALGWTGLQPRSASTFASRDEVIDALCASCHLPFYSDSVFKPLLRVGDEFALDGFYAAPTSQLGTALKLPATKTVRATPFQFGKSLGGNEDYFQILPRTSDFVDPQTLFGWALGNPPPSPAQQLMLFEAGKEAAEAWSVSHTDPNAAAADHNDDHHHR